MHSVFFSDQSGTAGPGGEKKLFGHVCLLLLVVSLLLIGWLTIVLGTMDSVNNVYPFSEPVVELAGDWTLTDSAGNASALTLPCTLSFGTDGVYALETVLSAYPGVISSPALGFYSNYTDVKIYLNGELLLSFPNETPAFIDGTGNTWQIVRLPPNYAGGTLRLELRCQLGSRVSYILKPVFLGAKASVLHNTMESSLFSLIVALGMLVLALLLAALYFMFRRRLGLNDSTLFLALFSAIFAVYIFCESGYARLTVPNGAVLYFTTLALLAVMPPPLIAFFCGDLGRRARAVAMILTLLCFVNLFVQLILHFTGVANLRVMVPATHGVLVLSIAGILPCMLRADPRRYPRARSRLLSGVPMLAGGCADILLLTLGHPSLNNSMWFTLGVLVFILLQFSSFLLSYFSLYRRAVESEVLRDMAFRDMLTGIGNRNAYEQRLKELGAGPVPEGFCCIVADINDLKYINDNYGHQAGDTMIQAAGTVMASMVLAGGRAFRTGGDEFIVLLEGMGETEVRRLADSIAKAAAARGRELAIPLTLAVGSGCYRSEDGNIQDFIRRIDSLMYDVKRTMKHSR